VSRVVIAISLIADWQAERGTAVGTAIVLVTATIRAKRRLYTEDLQAGDRAAADFRLFCNEKRATLSLCIRE
jgi:hypothetical protein